MHMTASEKGKNIAVNMAKKKVKKAIKLKIFGGATVLFGPFIAAAILILFIIVILFGGLGKDDEDQSGAGACASIAAIGAPFATNGPLNAGDKLTGRKGTLTSEMMFFAQAIVSKGQQMGVPERGLVIAIATALQESTLLNLPGGDRDSVGLFQQRPSKGWGTVQQITDPQYSSMKFFTALLAVKDWATLPLTKAAQTVQRSGFPDAYAKWEKDAAGIVTSILGALPGTPTTVASVSATTPSTAVNTQGSSGDDIDNGETEPNAAYPEDGECSNNIEVVLVNYDGAKGDTNGITGPVPPSEIVTVNGIRVHKVIAGQFQAMYEAALKEGLRLGGGGYRDSAGQIATRRKNCGTSYAAIYLNPAGSCSPPTARPGKSMHERGLALDLTCASSNTGSFKSSPCFPWMVANASTYGFYNLPSEPWHWSTNGN